VGQVALGGAGLAVGGALFAVGAGETGVGIATTPLGGVGVPITGLGVATVGLGLAVTGGAAATAYKGMGNILAPFRDPRPLPPGVVPGALPPQDPAATTEAARRWLADNPPPGAAGGPAAPAPPVPDLSGARVGLGPVALSPPPPGLQGALAGNGGFTPAPPLPPLPGFTPAPDAGRPSVVSTPIPDGPLAPPHTGNTDGPRVDLGRWQEAFPAMQPGRPDVFASQSGDEPSAINKEQALNDVRADIKKAGATVSSSPDDVAYLDSRERAYGLSPGSMTAVTIGDIIVVRPEHADDVVVLREELIHVQQQQSGLGGSTSVDALEIAARREMIEKAEKWGITREQVEVLNAEIKSILAHGY